MLDHLATFNLFKNTGFSSSFFWPLLNDLYWALFGLTFLLAFFFFTLTTVTPLAILVPLLWFILPPFYGDFKHP